VDLLQANHGDVNTRRKAVGEAETTVNRFVVGSAFVDPRLSLPRIFRGWINAIIALVLMLTDE
jgi:hypothetical protein